MQEHKRQLGFWSVWALAVGTMIGSGILLLPTALAPYGMLSYGGWILGAAGAIALVLVFGRLAGRTSRDGGPYVYVQEAFGDLAGFLMAWGYWIGFWGATRKPARSDRKSTRLNSSHSSISYAVFCLKKKNRNQTSQRPSERQPRRQSR